LDRDHSGSLSVEEILGIPEFAMNPLASRIIEMLGFNEEDLDFTSFVQLLSVFHPRAKRIEKLQCNPYSS
jgi:Ca2+-binding EF-hand superfamily protein